MGVLKKTSESEQYAEVLDFFTAEDVRHNLTFLMLVDSMLNKRMARTKGIIKVIDPEDETKVLYYTNDKFLEVIDLYGLYGFIY